MSLLGIWGQGQGGALGRLGQRGHLCKGQHAQSITKLSHKMSLLGLGGDVKGWGSLQGWGREYISPKVSLPKVVLNLAMRCLFWGVGTLEGWGVKGGGVEVTSVQRSACPK